MDDLIKLVRTYRVTAGLAERQRLTDSICRLIAPELSGFVFSTLKPHAAEDVLQEILISITDSLKKFDSHSKEEFWSWCKTIARRRVCDHLRKKKSDRLQPTPHEELLELVDASEQAEPLTAAVRHDL